MPLTAIVVSELRVCRGPPLHRCPHPTRCCPRSIGQRSLSDGGTGTARKRILVSTLAATLSRNEFSWCARRIDVLPIKRRDTFRRYHDQEWKRWVAIMVSSSTPAQTTDDSGSSGGAGYFRDRRAKVDGFRGAALHLARNAAAASRGAWVGHPSGARQCRLVADPRADPHRGLSLSPHGPARRRGLAVSSADSCWEPPSRGGSRRSS